MCKFNVCRAASCDGFGAILAARHRTFVLVVTSLFVLFVFPMHNKFLLLLHALTGGDKQSVLFIWT